MERLGGFERLRLSDISNLQGRPKPMNLDLKNKLTTTITPEEYIDRLQMKNKELVKLLEDRNELIELSVVELRKLRINLQKVQLQNSQLAQANSQMLAELNTGKDRLKVLQHDLACQNGLLKARKLVAGERKRRVAVSQKPSVEVDSSLRDELRKSCQEDVENEPKNGNQRTMKQSLGCLSVKPAHANEEANKKRRCSRRQSARLKTKDSEATEDSFDDNNAHCAVPSLHDDPIGTGGQIFPESSVKKENEGQQDSENACLPVANVVDATKKRRSRRESARFVKTLEPEATEESFEVKNAHHPVPSLHDDPVGTSGQISAESLAKNNKGNSTSENACLPVVTAVDATKRRPSRRVSARFVKTVQPEAMEDSFTIEDGISDDSLMHGNVINASGQTTPRSSVKEEGGGNLSSGVKTRESRRSSVGRPLRRAAEKVNSYQEISRKIKMRRPE